MPVPIDVEGLRVDEGMRVAPRARMAVVTPSHQSPLNVTMSQARRRALLDWAEKADGWIVEDDYDSEFHYLGFRPAALKSIDASDRVFFAGSFSKTLLPSLRLGVPCNARIFRSESCRGGLLDASGRAGVYAGRLGDLHG